MLSPPSASLPRIRSLGWLVALLLVPVWVSPSAGAETDVSVELEVTVDRMGFVDRLETARFVVTGLCLPADVDIQIEEAQCGVESVPDRVEGSVRKAALSFDATRTVEALPADVPGVETSPAGAPEQLTVVRLDLHRPGEELEVRLTGYAGGGLDPSPVPGSASGAGEIEGRSVVWRLENAEVGEHEFSVRFDPGAEAGLLSRFVPEVVVVRRDRSTTLFRTDDRAVPSPTSATRSATLLMEQVIAPHSGSPEMRTEELWAVAGGEVPRVWGTGLFMEARGDYDTVTSPQVKACLTGDLGTIAPGGLGTLNAAFASNYSTHVVGQRKVVTSRSFLRQGQMLTGLEMCLLTAPPQEGGFFTGEPSGIIWDGDGQAVSGTLGFHGLVRGEERLPEDSDGVVQPLVESAVAKAWSGLWANPAPNLEADMRGIHHIYSATLPMAARDGDVDNRDGETPIEGTPWTLRLPRGLCGVSAMVIHQSLSGTEYDPQTSLEASDGSDCLDTFSVVPKVGPGGYWLEGTGNGYDMEWSNVTFVTSMAATGSVSDDDGGVHEAVVVVPEGVEATAEVLHRGELHALDVGAGLWEVRFDATRGLTAHALRWR